jgi:polyhydroxyalkanoate synthesis repressor PhaR
MRLIKRYPNRKLYDTEAKRYITLQSVEALVHQGVDVKVMDTTTQEDITTATLSQVLFEKEKKHKAVPRSLLTGIIQGGGRIKDIVVQRFDRVFGGQLEATLRRLGLPSRREIEAMRKRIEQLEARVQTLERQKKGTPRVG